LFDVLLLSCPLRAHCQKYLRQELTHEIWLLLQQYWADESQPYKFVPVTAFVEGFQKTQAAQRTHEALDMPYDRAASPEGSLVQPACMIGRAQSHVCTDGASIAACDQFHAAFMQMG
jgi:hypothetical protein